MSKTFTQKIAWFFHLGRLPKDLRARLEAESRMEYLAEGIGVSVTFRNYRSPRMRCSWRKMGFIGYFALTEKRMVVRAGTIHRVNINVNWDDPLFRQTSFVIRSKYLSLKYDAAAAHNKASGTVEVRLHLPDVQAAVEILERAGAPVTCE